MQQSVQILSNLNYQIGKVINTELQNSVQTQIAVAFLKMSGIKVIQESLESSLNKGASFELIVGLDFKTTDPFAMKFFLNLHRKNPKVNFYCYGDRSDNKTDIVFHPKIYLFRNQNEHSSIVGSTNLTGGGLTSNFEVNTVFNEKNPIFYSQLQAIYNSIKYTDTLFTPDEDYLEQYSDVFKAFEKNEENARKDKGLKKVIEDIAVREQNLPGTIPSIKVMVLDFMKKELEKGNKQVSLSDIYKNLEGRVKNSEYASYFKMDTFRNSIRGEINHNEEENSEERSLRLFKRIEKGKYSITENGLKYSGR